MIIITFARIHQNLLDTIFYKHFAAEIAAAEAALARLAPPTRKPLVVAKLATPPITSAQPTPSLQASSSKSPVTSNAPVPSSQLSAMFTCPLTGVSLPRGEIRLHIIETLQNVSEQSSIAYWAEHCSRPHQLVADNTQDLELSALLLHTASTDPDKLALCIKTLITYIGNLESNPADVKYRRIRVGNKAFQERVASLTGGLEFIAAAGFSQFSEEEQDSFISFEGDVDLTRLQQAREVLQTTQPLKGKLDRNATVYSPSSKALPRIDLPDDFYDVTADDLAVEAAIRRHESDRELTLRTQAMREGERPRRQYMFAVIRVRMPDGHVVQGTFHANETVQDVAHFVSTMLADETAEFYLHLHPSHEKLATPTQTLLSAGLVPASVVNCAAGAPGPDRLTLKRDVLESAQSL